MDGEQSLGHFSPDQFGACDSNIESKGIKMEGHPEVHNIFKPGHGGDGGGNAPWAAILPALMAERNVSRNGGDFGFGGGGFGSGLVGGVLGGLLFGRRGVLGGEGGDGGPETRITDDINNVAVLNKLGSIEAAIPLSGAQTANVILQQTNQITQLAAAAQLANAAGFSTTKDAVTNVGTIVLQGLNAVNMNVAEQACSVKQVVVNDGEKTRALLTSRFQLEDATEINKLNARVIELQSEGRRSHDAADLRLQITNTNTAVAAQAQGQVQAQQQQQGFLLSQIVNTLGGLVQVAHATNNNVIAGNTGAVTTGAQTANPVNVAT